MTVFSLFVMIKRSIWVHTEWSLPADCVRLSSSLCLAFILNEIPAHLRTCHKRQTAFSLFCNSSEWPVTHSRSWLVFVPIFSSCVIRLSANELARQPYFSDLIRPPCRMIHRTKPKRSCTFSTSLQARLTNVEYDGEESAEIFLCEFR